MMMGVNEVLCKGFVIRIWIGTCSALIWSSFYCNEVRLANYIEIYMISSPEVTSAQLNYEWQIWPEFSIPNTGL